jgi:hypothetical protein
MRFAGDIQWDKSRWNRWAEWAFYRFHHSHHRRQQSHMAHMLTRRWALHCFHHVEKQRNAPQGAVGEQEEGARATARANDICPHAVRQRSRFPHQAVSRVAWPNRSRSDHPEQAGGTRIRHGEERREASAVSAEPTNSTAEDKEVSSYDG